MSLKIVVDCSQELDNYSLGIFNHIKKLEMPAGVTAYISFSHTPKDEELYPLSAVVMDLDSDGDLVSEPREAFLHTVGTSADKMTLICSEVVEKGGYVDVVMQEVIELESSVKNALLTMHKDIQPYEYIGKIEGSHDGATTLTFLNTVLDCDKILVCVGCTTLGGGGYATSGIMAKVNGKIVAYAGVYTGEWRIDNNNEAFGVRNQILEIIGNTGSTSYPVTYTIYKFNLKA